MSEQRTAKPLVDQFHDMLHRDQTALAAGLNEVLKVVSGFRWATESRGCYEWDDDRFHGEMKNMLDAVQKAAQHALDAWKRGPLPCCVAERAESETDAILCGNSGNQANCPVCHPVAGPFAHPDRSHKWIELNGVIRCCLYGCTAEKTDETAAGRHEMPEGIREMIRANLDQKLQAHLKGVCSPGCDHCATIASEKTSCVHTRRANLDTGPGWYCLDCGYAD